MRRKPLVRPVAVVVFPGFQLLDATGPIAALEIAGRFASGERASGQDPSSAYDVAVVASRPGMVRSSAGVALEATRATHRRPWHTVLVSGGDGTRAAFEPALSRFLLGAAARGARIASVCSGSFLLAAVGLLDGRRATTHWSRCEELARRFPRVHVEPDRIFTRDGDVWTSAGISAGIDLALALIGEDLGEEIAKRTAQQLVVYHRRPGGQSQFSSLLEVGRPDGPFAELLAWAREHLDVDLGVERLARRAAMSPRNFARRFAAEVGATPARAIERMRVEVARERVEDGDDSIERISRDVGFGDPERMRRSFLRQLGQPPQALRRARRASG